MNNLDKIFSDINKKFGKNSIMTLGETPTVTENLYSTGSLLLDRALGGGVAVGRVIELYGLESSGKSTLCLQLVAQVQKAGKKVAYLDTENAMDPVYAKKLGVDVDALAFAQPSSAEETLEIADMLAKSGEFGLIIVDSVAAMVPQAELDGEMGDMTIGLMARLMSKALRKITNTLNTNDCTIVFINQLREKISTGWSGGGETTTTPGGRALKFFSSQRIELKKIGQIKEKDEVIGNNVRAKIVKNKVGIPMKQVDLQLIFGRGFSADDEVMTLALDYEFIKQSGAWFTTHDGQRVQGKAGVRAYYEEYKDKSEELRDMVINRLTNKDTRIEDLKIDQNTGEVLEE